jgi:hypothetical protein
MDVDRRPQATIAFHLPKMMKANSNPIATIPLMMRTPKSGNIFRFLRPSAIIAAAPKNNAGTPSKAMALTANSPKMLKPNNPPHVIQVRITHREADWSGS